jgi:hypothetical protein
MHVLACVIYMCLKRHSVARVMCNIFNASKFPLTIETAPSPAGFAATQVGQATGLSGSPFRSCSLHLAARRTRCGSGVGVCMPSGICPSPLLSSVQFGRLQNAHTCVSFSIIKIEKNRSRLFCPRQIRKFYKRKRFFSV